MDLGRYAAGDKRHHLTGNYDVMPTAPLLWGNVALPALGLLFALSAGLFGLDPLWLPGPKAGTSMGSPVRWLTISWAIPVLDLLRFAGVPIPMTFLEPLLLAGVTGAAAGALAETFHDPLLRWPAEAGTVWFAAVGLLAILLGGWWYHQGQQAYDNYLLGYNDFGHFAWRVANTWAGRGFLLETPGLSAFWDHFNPGLALFAPLWGAWPDPRLFLAIQAICLAGRRWRFTASRGSWEHAPPRPPPGRLPTWYFPPWANST